jgi:hypothetical protein
MNNQLLTTNVWQTLTNATRRNRHPALIAVAYFGRGAGKLLPLPPRSQLVVDASEAAVKSGQTCPAELHALIKKNVRVYSVQNLHAKVFIGSANVSRHSAGTLVEAMVVTTDRETVEAARQFVDGLCVHELGFEAVKRLKGMYRPPRIRGGRPRPRPSSEHEVLPELPRVLIVQLERIDPPRGSESTEEAGRKVAAKLQEKPRRHVLEDFWRSGQCPYRPGDIVVQVIDESEGYRLVSPPATVIHTRVWRRGARSCTFVYVEVPKRRRIALGRLAKHIGRGAKKRLERDGLVNRDLAKRLLSAWKA